MGGGGSSHHIYGAIGCLSNDQLAVIRSAVIESTVIRLDHIKSQPIDLIAADRAQMIDREHGRLAAAIAAAAHLCPEAIGSDLI